MYIIIIIIISLISTQMADVPRPESKTHSEPPANAEDIPQPHSQPEEPLTPVGLCRSSQTLQEAPEQSRMSSDPSSRQRASGGSRSASSVSSDSPQSKGSRSSRANGSVCSDRSASGSAGLVGF